MQHLVFSRKVFHACFCGLVLKVSSLYCSILVHRLCTCGLKIEMDKPFWTSGSKTIFINRMP